MRPGKLVEVNHLSKKFCRNLKRSLWYGVKDITGELLLRKGSRPDLRRDEFWALRDISFDVSKGEMLGLIGHNGSGKSTLLKLLNGLVVPDEGNISIKGKVSALIELGTGFNPILSGKENIYVNAAVLGISKKKVDQNLQTIIDFAEIDDFIDAPVQSYSSGMKVRLGFSIASHLNPNLLLLDEVLSVGDPSFRARCYRRLEHFRESGGSAIFVSHNTTAIEATCDRVMLFDKGQIVTIGKPSEVVQQFEEMMLTKSVEADKRLDRGKPENAENQFEQPMEILDVSFFGTSREAEPTFNHGEPIELRIAYLTHRPVKSPYFDIIFRKSGYGSGILTRMSMFWDKTNLKEVNGSGVVRCLIKNPSLTAGHYSVDVGVLANPTSKWGLKWYAASQTRANFFVRSDNLKTNMPGITAASLVSMPPVILDYTWEIETESVEPDDRCSQDFVNPEVQITDD